MKLVSRWGLDAFLVVLATGEAVAILLSAGDARWIAAGFAALSALVLGARRWHTLVASIVSLAAIGVCLYLLRDAPTVVFFGLMATFAIVAAVNSTRDALIAWFAGAALIAVCVWFSDAEDRVGNFLLTLALCTVLWIAGLLVSRRTRQATVMAMRLEVNELERARAVQDERGRIARELHDVVSHGLTVVVVQTLAARSAVADLSGAAAAEVDRHMAAVESAAREALADMRRMLGLLQSGDGTDEAPAPPAPGLADLAQLCDRAREAGLEIDDSGVDAALQLPKARELSVYRIVQEALTNAIKHAPGSHVRVRITRSGTVVDVEISNGGQVPAGIAAGTVGEGGRGLLGMRERVAAYGGTFQAGPTASDGFTVWAALPISELEVS